jgi:DNA (cytosine-5)-methyltransferase 1
MTDKELKLHIEDLIRVCYVFPEIAIDNLDFWTSLSADHFYIRYQFPSLDVNSWNDRQPVDQKMNVCSECCREKLERIKLMKDFLFMGKRQPLRAMDLFGGVGAFGLGMEDSGVIKVTHAIEIAPSAAKTFKYSFFFFPCNDI